MTATEYLAKYNYDQAGNVLLGVEDAVNVARSYDLLSEADKKIVHEALGEDFDV